MLLLLLLQNPGLGVIVIIKNVNHVSICWLQDKPELSLSEFQWMLN